MYKLQLTLLTVVLMALAGCGPGIADYSSRIGNTEYYFTHNDSANRYIWRKLVKDGQDVIIDKKVIDFKFDDEYIVAVRQVARSYNCEERTIATELLYQYEYWVIDLNAQSVIGPMDEMHYQHAYVPKFAKRSLTLDRVDDLKKQYKPHPLKGCTNPALIK